MSELLNNPESIRRYIRSQRVAETYRYTSMFEERLWNLAELAPFGAKVILTNDDLTNPYLLRVYLGPDRDKTSTFLTDVLGAPRWVARAARAAHRPFLHYFFRGDIDRAFHNHPFKKSYSIILTGGYLDHRWDFDHKRVNTKLVKPGHLNVIGRGDFHKVELLPGKKCWTLFFAGERVQDSNGTDWDFYDPETEEYTPWGQWHSPAAGSPVKSPAIRDMPFARVGDDVIV